MSIPSSTFAHPFALRHLAGAALLACALAAQAQPAPAQVRAYDLPAQPLGSTLARIAAEGGQQLSIDADLVRALTAPAVRGRFTPEQAARAALAGSGLELVRTEGGNWGLRRLPAGERQTPTTSATTLGEVKVTAQAERGAVTEGSGTYTAGAVTIGKTPLSLKDTPQSVTVVSRQQIEEQNLIGVDDALRQATGITIEQWYGDAVEIKSRGFGITNFRYDGGGVTEQGSRSYTFLPDLLGFDHVEVLRGADSLSAGAGMPGGSVNLVRKRPTVEPQLLWNATLGSWNFKRAEIDVSRPLNEAGSVRGRLAVAAQDRDYFYDNADAAKQVVYGVVEADLAPGTVLSGGITYERMRAKPWVGSGVPRYVDGGLLEVPRSTNYVYDWNWRDTDTQEAFVRWEHALPGDWKLNLNANYRHEATVGYMAAPGGGSIVERDTGMGRAILDVFDEDFYAKQLSIDVNASGTVDWGGRRHHLLAGLDWMDYRLHYEAASGFGVADVNYLNFDPGSYPYPSMPQFPANSWSPWIHDYDKLGAYASGRFEIADGTHLIVGGRLNNIDGSEKIDRRVLTPYGGLTYALDARHTVYASVSDVFESQNSYLDAAMRPLDPMTGRNHEIGVKGEWWNGRLNGSVALYQMERTGQAVKVPGTQSPCCYVARGKVVSKGVDLELSGALTPRWNLTAGYTVNRNVNKQDDLPFDSVTPRHLFKLWTAYQLPDALSQWKIGGGLVSQGRFKSYGFELPGFTVVNAFAEYRIHPKLSLALNIGNLFDRSYYQTGGWYGEPRSVMVSLRGRF